MTSAARKRVVAFISGGGSNMLALAKAAQAPDFPAEIVAVFSDKADAGGLAGAERRAALLACFAGKRPDLAQRAECRKEARAKGLDGEDLRAALASCARNRGEG